MAKWIFTVISIMFSFPALGDVNSQVAACLSSQASGGGSSSKSACIQAAINSESTNQINKMFTTYANFVDQQINAYGSNAGGNTPIPGKNQAAAPSSPRMGVMNGSFYPKTGSIYPSQPPASSGQTQTVSPTPPPISQTPKQTPQSQGGIQYY